MTIPLSTGRLSLLTLAWMAAFAVGCGGDDNKGNGSAANDGGSGAPVPGGTIDATVLAACPEATTLIETADWPVCLAGVRMIGTELFGNACELRVADNGAFDYFRDGELALSIPPRSEWGAAMGTYQNEGGAGGRVFLASIAPDLPAVEGQARITRLSLSFFEPASHDDLVEVRYLDEKLASQTYNCKVTVF